MPRGLPLAPCGLWRRDEPRQPGAAPAGQLRAHPKPRAAPTSLLSAHAEPRAGAQFEPAGAAAAAEAVI